MGFYHLFQTKTTCFGTDLVYIATRNDTLSQTKTTCFGHKIMTTSCENDYFHVICESIWCKRLLYTISTICIENQGITSKLWRQIVCLHNCNMLTGRLLWQKWRQSLFYVIIICEHKGIICQLSIKNGLSSRTALFYDYTKTLWILFSEQDF